MRISRTVGSAFAALFIVGTSLTGLAAPALAASPVGHQAHALVVSSGPRVITPIAADKGLPVSQLRKFTPNFEGSYVSRGDNGTYLTGDGGSAGPDRPNLHGGYLPVPVHKVSGVQSPVIQRNLVKHIRRAHARHADTISPGASFDGMNFSTGQCSCAPPDTNAVAGLHQVVETVNTSFAVYDKTGTQLMAPTHFSAIWGGFNGTCAISNAGDPVVLFDSAADRWLITQFTAAPPYSECVAISTSDDPTGSYYRYQYVESNSNFYDYPHLGIWNASGNNVYTMTTNVFENATRYAGPGVQLIDRAKLLVGDPSAPMVDFGPINGANCLNDNTFAVCRNPMLPADAETTPANNAGAIFLEYPDPGPPTHGVLNEYTAQFDAANPGNSTFSLENTNSNIAAFSNGFNNCGPTTRDCIVQPGSVDTTTSCTQAPLVVCRVDAIADRLMYRVAFRDVGGTDYVTANWTVNAGSSGDQAAPMWVQMDATGGAFNVVNQGVYAPDATNNRWMGSVGMDRNGDVLLGYSISSSTTFPSIGVAGRAPGDTANTLGAEQVAFSGNFSQEGVNRWGDYSEMKADPADQCTFWYSQEYTHSGNSFDWATRILSFKFAGCDTTATSMAGSSAPTSSENSADSVTVTMHDANGDVASSYRGTVHFTSTDLAATLPADYSFTAADAGSHTFPVEWGTAGSQKLFAVDTGNPTLNAEVDVTVTNPAASISLSAPNSVGAGLPFTYTVTAKDSGGNTLTDYTGTVHFTSSDGQAVLPSDYTFVPADNGTHTFTSAGPFSTATIRLFQLGSQSVTATDTGSGVAGTANITVDLVSTFVNGTSGSNSNDCLTSGSACATITGAIAKTSLGGTTTVAAGTYNENVVIDHNITLTGGSAMPTINGGGHDSTVVVANGVTTTVNGFEITGGNGTGRGGGGGVFNGSGTVTLSNDYIHGNTAGGSGALGGGVLNNLGSGGTVMIDKSTISGNTLPSNFGGGFYAAGCVDIVTNSTIANNTAAADGAIRWRGSAGECGSVSNAMVNTTVTGNHVTAGGQVGGIDKSGANPAHVALGNDLIAQNTNSASLESDCGSSYTTLGNNLTGSSCGGLSNGTNGDQVGSAGSPINALLGPLGMHGGLTPTAVPMFASPAIDAGSNTLCANVNTINNFDQRGRIRPVGASCDIGSVEVNPLVAIVAASGAYGTTPSISLAASSGAITYNPSGQAANVTGTLTCNTNATSTSHVAGNPYSISGCSGLSDSGYDVLYNTAASTYTVTPAPLTVTALAQSVTFGNDFNHALNASTASAPGLVNGDTLATLNGSISSAYTVGSPAGTYSLVPSISDGDYALTPSNGTLTVNLDNVTLTYLGPASVQPNKKGKVTATFSAKIVSASTGSPIVGRPVTITFNNYYCTHPSNSAGVASCTLTGVPAKAGTRTVSLSFFGDTPNTSTYDYAAGSGHGTVTVKKKK